MTEKNCGFKQEIETENERGETPLQAAAWKGSAREVKELLRAGADPMNRGSKGVLPIDRCWDAETRRELRRAIVKREAAEDENVICNEEKETGKRSRRSALRNRARILINGSDDPKRVLRLIESEKADLEDRDEIGRTLLFFAADCGHRPKTVKALLEAGAAPETSDVRGQTPLMAAAANGNVEVVVDLLKAGASVDTKDEEGKTPGHHAAKNGTGKTLKALLDAGADQYAEDTKGKDLFMTALYGWRDSLAKIEILFERGRDPISILDEVERASAMSSAFNDVLAATKRAIVKTMRRDDLPRETFATSGCESFFLTGEKTPASLVLEEKGDETPKTASKRTAETELTRKSMSQSKLDADFFVASRDGDLGKMKEALRAGARGATNIDPSDGQTALHRIAGWTAKDMRAYFSAVRTLLARGAKIDERSFAGETPLHRAARTENEPLVLALVLCGADPNARDKDGKTPLHYAFTPDVVRLFSKSGADPNARDKDGKTPLHVVASKSFSGYLPDDRMRRVIAALLSVGADPTAIDSLGKSVLDSALPQAKKTIEKAIIEKMSAAGLPSESRQIRAPRGSNAPSAAPSAATRAVRDVVEADPQSAVRKELERGWTPLYIAVRRGDLTGVRALLKSGVDPNIANESGEAPVHAASEDNGRSSVLRSILEAGANPNAKNAEGLTPLHLAYNGPNTSPETFVKTRLLLDAGADPNVTNNNGETPLHWCVESGDLKCAGLLLARGADPNLRDTTGTSSIDLAEKVWVHRDSKRFNDLVMRRASPAELPKESSGEKPEENLAELLVTAARAEDWSGLKALLGGVVETRRKHVFATSGARLYAAAISRGSLEGIETIAALGVPADGTVRAKGGRYSVAWLIVDRHRKAWRDREKLARAIKLLDSAGADFREERHDEEASATPFSAAIEEADADLAGALASVDAAVVPDDLRRPILVQSSRLFLLSKARVKVLEAVKKADSHAFQMLADEALWYLASHPHYGRAKDVAQFARELVAAGANPMKPFGSSRKTAYDAIEHSPDNPVRAAIIHGAMSAEALPNESASPKRQKQLLSEELAEAIEHLDVNAAKKALKSGADPNARNRDGVAPLEALFARVPIPIPKDFRGKHGFVSLLTTLLNAGADPNAKPAKTLYFPVHYAAVSDSWSNTAMLKLLLSKGADPDVKESFAHMSPLHLAVRQLGGSTNDAARLTEVLEALLAAGADFAAKDDYGKTILDYAKEAKGQTTFEIVSKAIQKKMTATDLPRETVF